MNRNFYVVYSQCYHWNKFAKVWDCPSLPEVRAVCSSALSAQEWALNHGDFLTRLCNYRFAKKVGDVRDLRRGKVMKLFFYNATVHTRYVLLVESKPLF